MILVCKEKRKEKKGETKQAKKPPNKQNPVLRKY